MGCGGNMRPEFHADVYSQYVTFMKAKPTAMPELLASGDHDDRTRLRDFHIRLPAGSVVLHFPEWPGLSDA